MAIVLVDQLIVALYPVACKRNPINLRRPFEVGFDPANEICPDERYVRLASGLDYADTAPVSGMRIGTAPEMITISVSVEQ